MRLAGFRKKNIRALSSKIFLVLKIFFKKVRKIIQFSEAQVAANSDIQQVLKDIQRFTGNVYDWSILND